ncbi:alpha/beta fold hydrolase [Paraburkholderia sp. SIMBA_049]
MNDFPADFPSPLTGFGGDRAKTQAQHRASLKKTPVILVHGNAGNSVHPKWGMVTMKGYLKGNGYQDCEIWAMDYLGENNSAQDVNDPHRNHIEQFSLFVDRVREYLGVKKLDFIAHSLGCGMVNAYLRGLQSDGQWDNSQQRLEVASTFVSLAGATYGLGSFSISEFKTGSEFETRSHEFKKDSRVVVDDSPDGENVAAEQEAPVSSWIAVTELDNDEITYVAFTAAADFVDAQNPDTGRREGADLNRRFNLGSGLDGHEKIIKSQTVFDAFKAYLNQNPPVAPATITVDKDSGSYGSALPITVTVNPATASVHYTAERLTKQFQAGYINRSVSETRTGTLSNGQSLNLATDGMWEVMFGADGADDVRRAYGVGIVLPEVNVLTDNATPFNGSLDVAASTTRGALYYSTDREGWIAGSVATITRTATVSFIAIDSDGIASVVVSRAYEKYVTWTDSRTATLTEHFIARRLTVDQYVSLGQQLGFNAVITLYLVNGNWVRNPEVPSATAVGQPLAARAARVTILSADRASGEYAGGFDVTIAAPSEAPSEVKVYYTKDGSDPSDSNNSKRTSFHAKKTFSIKDSGHHSILCYAQDGSGHGVFESFAWSIGGQQ